MPSSVSSASVDLPGVSGLSIRVGALRMYCNNLIFIVFL